MKPDKFRFESLLKYRTFIEETMKTELSALAERLDMEEKELLTLKEIWKQAVEDLKERQARQVPSHEILMYHNYLHQISLEIEIQQKKVGEAKSAYNEKRELLVNAAQERKIVEKLREKDGLERKEKNSRAEKKAMDETAKNRFVRDNC